MEAAVKAREEGGGQEGEATCTDLTMAARVSRSCKGGSLLYGA